MIFRQVDGRLLNLLTVDDLSFLRVSNLLHHYSIRRGIQVPTKRNELLSSIYYFIPPFIRF